MFLAEAVNGLRRALGISQERLARMLNITTSAVRTWEQKRRRPNETAVRAMLALCPDEECRQRFLQAGGNGDSRFKIPNSASRDTVGGGHLLQGATDMTPLSAEPAPSVDSSEMCRCIVRESDV